MLGAGCPYGLPAPTETSASRAPVARRNRGSWLADPWCGTLSRSARRSPGRSARIAAWASGSTSPVSSITTPCVCSRTTTLALFGWDPAWMIRCGHRTFQPTPATERSSPAPATTTRTRASDAQPRTRRASSGGSSSGLTSICATDRPRRTPGRPSTWSAWKCVSRTSGTRRTPRSRRHRSIDAGSGPASTTTAVPSPTDTASPSPWPTSHATRSHPGGGHPRFTTAGMPVDAATAATASSAIAGAGLRATSGTASLAATSTATITATPVAPLGQPTDAKGAPAATCATTTSHHVGIAAMWASTVAAHGHTGPATATRAARTVATGTAGSARTFAGTDTSPTCGATRTSTGAVATWAASAMATASASGPGQRRASRARQPGARTSSPAVASTDRANPAERARNGSTISSTTTAAASVAGPARSRAPRTVVASTSRPIRVARTTLGSGLASTRKPHSPTAPAAGTAYPRIPSQRAATSTAARTNATFEPDTATRCVIPAVVKSRAVASGSPEVSPSTSPGSSPRSAAGSPATDWRSRARTAPASRCSGGGRPTSSGRPLTERIAATSSPPDGSAARNRPATRTVWPGSTSSHAAPGAISRTGSRVDTTVPRPTTRRRSARTAYSVGARLLPTTRDRSRTGSAVTTASARTLAACAASRTTGPLPMTDMWIAVATDAPAAQAQTAAETSMAERRAAAVTRDGRRHRRASVPSATPSAARSAPIHSVHCGGRVSADSAAAHAAAAGRASRRSAAAGAPAGPLAPVGSDGPLTRAPGVRCRPASWTRCHQPHRARRRW